MWLFRSSETLYFSCVENDVNVGRYLCVSVEAEREESWANIRGKTKFGLELLKFLGNPMDRTDGFYVVQTNSTAFHHTAVYGKV